MDQPLAVEPARTVGPDRLSDSGVPERSAGWQCRALGGLLLWVGAGSGRVAGHRGWGYGCVPCVRGSRVRAEMRVGGQW